MTGNFQCGFDTPQPDTFNKLLDAHQQKESRLRTTSQDHCIDKNIVDIDENAGQRKTR